MTARTGAARGLLGESGVMRRKLTRPWHRCTTESRGWFGLACNRCRKIATNAEPGESGEVRKRGNALFLAKHFANNPTSEENQ